MESHVENIRNYIKEYYPEYGVSFSPGEMTTLLSDIVGNTGDLLNDYTKYNFNESLVTTVSGKDNIYELSQSYNVKPRLKKNSYVKLLLKILLPEGTERLPIIKPYSIFGASFNSDISYVYPYFIDFNNATKLGAVTDNNNNIYNEYQIEIIAISGEVTKIEVETPDKPVPYLRIDINDTEATYINKIQDSEGNEWNETTSLGNSIITYTTIINNDISIKNKDTEYRFITYIENDQLSVIFGGGINVEDSSNSMSYDPSISINRPVYSKGIDYDISLNDKISSYGKSPSNTTLTIEYITGGGLKYNVLPKQIDKVNTIESDYFDDNPNILDLVTVVNPESPFGGGNQDSIEYLRNKTLKGMISGYTCITQDDYEYLLLNAPLYLGHIDKIKAINNPANRNIELYMLNKNYNDNYEKLDLSPDNHIYKNIMAYVNLHKPLTDNILLRNAYIINIGIDIVVKVDNLKNNIQIQLEIIDRIKTLLGSDHMNIGSDINISLLISELMNISGINNVISFKVYNINGDHYSDILYNIEAAQEDNIIYSSVEPSIFEVLSPDNDIKVDVI